jgi:hypothetical protein
MAENFTAKQKEIVARKMGYDGPMQMFDEYLASTPSDAQRYASVTSKFAERMAKGGVVTKSKVRRYAEGGTVNKTPEEYGFKAPTGPSASALQNWYNSKTGETFTATSGGYEPPSADWSTSKSGGSDLSSPSPAQPATGTPVGGVRIDSNMLSNGLPPPPQTGGPTTTPITTQTGTGAPVATTAPGYTAATTEVTDAMKAVTPTTVEAAQATPAQIAETATAAAPTTVTAAQVTPTLAAESIKTGLEAMPAVEGAVSEEAKAKAVTQEPTTTAVGGIEAAQATAGTVAPVAERVAQEGELISGPAVDMARVEESLAKTQAAQGVVAEEMTVQGQLNKLLTDFDAGSPPPWAAASMRAATAKMAARGIGASSMAGQAIIQATLEAAMPIAITDAKTQETMALQNLSNRQAVAIDLGKQRAAFLGQEFDQAFETRVKNAATISDIADKNFDASVTIALENARIASSTNLANLSARNALVLAEAAQVASLETANLNNRQMVAVDNAKAFLAMDLKNLDIEQQTAVFKAKTIADSLISDAGFANAAAATNATNKLEADRVSATLALTAEQYNATERNKIQIANLNATNELVKFNAQEANDRAEFNSRMAGEINVANAKILADVSTANTAAINAANAVNAKNATDLSASVYAQTSQTYRDLMSYSFKTGENEKDRIRDLAVASINRSAAIEASKNAADGASSASWGQFAYEAVRNWPTS